jgi:hypothetical protein
MAEKASKGGEAEEGTGVVGRTSQKRFQFRVSFRFKPERTHP